MLVPLEEQSRGGKARLRSIWHENSPKIGRTHLFWTSSRPFCVYGSRLGTNPIIEPFPAIREKTLSCGDTEIVHDCTSTIIRPHSAANVLLNGCAFRAFTAEPVSIRTSFVASHFVNCSHFIARWSSLRPFPLLCLIVLSATTSPTMIATFWCFVSEKKDCYQIFSVICACLLWGCCRYLTLKNSGSKYNIA